MNLFYTPDINGDFYIFNESESKHLIRVFRAVNGDEVVLTDGLGFFYNGVIQDAHPKRCIIKIVKKNKVEKDRNYKIHLAIAPTKNIARTEWFIEKATEIGIDEISLINCQFSERKIVKTDRLNKIIISALKQSLKAWKPKINEMVSLDDFLRTDSNNEKFIAYCQQDDGKNLKVLYTPNTDVLILIGPEGGFADDEIEKAAKAGFKMISLGPSRLRTETAALVAVHTIHVLNL